MADIIDTLHPKTNLDDNLYPNIKKENIPNGSIDTSKLADNSVTSSKLAEKDMQTLVNTWLNSHPEATTTVEDDSLTTAKYKDGSITTSKIADKNVTYKKLTSSLQSNFISENDVYNVNYFTYVHSTNDGASGIINKMKNNQREITDVLVPLKCHNGIGTIHCGIIKGSEVLSTDILTIDNVKNLCIAISTTEYAITTTESAFYDIDFEFDNVLVNEDYIYIVVWCEYSDTPIYFVTESINEYGNMVDINDSIKTLAKYSTYDYFIETGDLYRFLRWRINYVDYKLNLTNQWTGKICATLGTSLTANGGWDNVIKEELGFAKMYNRGSGGSTLANFTGYGLTDYAGYTTVYNDESLYDESRYTCFYDEEHIIPGAITKSINNWYCSEERINLLPIDADLVLVDLCTNDFYRSYDKEYITEEEFTSDTIIKTPYGESIGAYDYNDKHYQDAFMLMIKRIQTRCPKARIVVWGMLYNSTITNINESMNYYYNLIELTKTMCQKTGTYFINTISEMGVNVFNSLNIIQDGVHPYKSTYTNEKGKYSVANVIIGHLRNIYPIEG